MPSSTSSIPEREALLASLRDAGSDEEVLDICRRRVLHGTPFIFSAREDDFYCFRRRIADKFSISFHEVYITGSAKLGFSLREDHAFDLESDIDVAIVAPSLYERIMGAINDYQMSLRESRRTVTERELELYHNFLEYTAIGWVRPDKLPLSFNVSTLKDDWFAFFSSLSFGGSEVGNYHVSAGVFKSYSVLENYQYRGLLRIRNGLRIETTP